MTPRQAAALARANKIANAQRLVREQALAAASQGKADSLSQPPPLVKPAEPRRA